MLFSEIIGQQAIKEKLIQTVQGQRVSHGQLFCGPEGTGKLALAIAYAQYVNCTNKQPNDSCGSCPSCLKFQKLIHPDLHFVFPVAKVRNLSNPVSDDFLAEWRKFLIENRTHSLEDWMLAIGTENQQVSIYSSESEAILRKLSFKTYEAEYKVMIIWQPERMNTVASNKLLKILEEPPPKTLFLLVSDEPDQLLGTILSRTQMVKIAGIEAESIIAALKTKVELPEIELSRVAKQANGNFNRALAIIHASEENLQNFNHFTALMRLAYSRNLQEAMKWVDLVAGLGREKQKSLIMYALRMLRENFAFNLAKSAGSFDFIFLTNAEQAFSEKFSPFITEKNITIIYKEFNDSFYHIERNAYAKIVLLDMTLKLMKALRM